MGGQSLVPSPFEIVSGTPIILYLQTPREKIWGVLLALLPSGIMLRGIDLASFEDWMRQEAQGDESLLGLTTVFYPMTRVERMERDETVGAAISYSERFALTVGRTVQQALGFGVTDRES
jgi:hypothetical protein